jgi:hypothetical protein
MEKSRMKSNKPVARVNERGTFLIRFLISASILFLMVGCSNLIEPVVEYGGGELSEFVGTVVGKRDSDQILVVPNVAADTIQNKTEEELLAIAIEQNGIYFSVEQEIFETVTVGTMVRVHYDPDDGEEATIPPRRRSQGVEIVTSSGATP